MPTTQPSPSQWAEARAHAQALFEGIGYGDAADLAGAVGAALQAQHDAIEAAERHSGREWLRQRAVGADRVIAAMATYLEGKR
jgi:hypothetical protein